MQIQKGRGFTKHFGTYQNLSMRFVNHLFKLVPLAMRAKYKTITSTHFFDVFLPLDDKMELKKAWDLQHRGNKHSIIPIGNVCSYFVRNLISNNSS